MLFLDVAGVLNALTENILSVLHLEFEIKGSTRRFKGHCSINTLVLNPENKVKRFK